MDSVTRLKGLCYRLWSRFLTWFGDIYFATELPLVKASHIREVMRLAKPGDVICRRYNSFLDSHFIKGEFTHSGVVVDAENMVHAVAEGVGLVDIIDYVKDCDGFVLLRPRPTYFPNAAVHFARLQIGKPYDFVFRRGLDAYYCHELAYAALQQGGVQFDDTGHDYILFEEISEPCYIVYRPCLEGRRMKRGRLLQRNNNED